MKRKIIISLCIAPVFLIILTLACSNQNSEGELIWTDPPTSADTLYQNPLFEPDLADPSFIRTSDGWFYAYGTENEWAPGISRVTPIARSKNMVKWEFVANAFSTKPSWKSTN